MTEMPDHLMIHVSLLISLGTCSRNISSLTNESMHPAILRNNPCYSGLVNSASLFRHASIHSWDISILDLSTTSSYVYQRLTARSLVWCPPPARPASQSFVFFLLAAEVSWFVAGQHMGRGIEKDYELKNNWKSPRYRASYLASQSDSGCVRTGKVPVARDNPTSLILVRVENDHGRKAHRRCYISGVSCSSVVWSSRMHACIPVRTFGGHANKQRDLYKTE